MNVVAHQLLSDLLESRTGQGLSQNRQWRVGTALSGVFREHGLTTLDELAARIQKSRNSPLAQQVVEALLNNETYFFRDRTVFDQLAQSVLPRLAQARAATKQLTIWSAGCSTGQEALSLAMMIAEDEARWDGWTVTIVGTDVSAAAIASARNGVYSQFEIQRGLGMMQMLRWFEESPQGWRACEKLRRMVRFELHSVLAAPPRPAPFDLVLCRNVLLYFEADTRACAYDRLAGAVAADGFLMLGAGETVVGHTKLFQPDRGFASLYRPAGVQVHAGPSREARAAGSRRSA